MSSPSSTPSTNSYTPRPPSPGQRELLGFFGRVVPATAREAYEAIQAELSTPGGELRWREERARRFVARMEEPRRAKSDAQDSHAVCFQAACVLVQGYDLPLDMAERLLAEYCQRSDEPWTDQEIRHKIRQADAQPGLRTREGIKPRGCMAQGKEGSTFRPNAQTRAAAGMATETEAKKKVEYEPETLKRLAAPWADTVELVWLANRSSADPAEISAARFLEGLYRPGEKVLCFTDDRSQGEALWPDEAPPQAGPNGVWFLAQPVTGQRVPNPRGKPGSTSRRIAECVTAFRYMVLESDEAPVRDWLGFIVQIPLRIEALYTSGGRSVHALVRVDCATKSEWDAEKQAMMPFLMGSLMCGADRGTWSAVRLTRLPGTWRAEKGKDQKLLYFQPSAPLRPICELPVTRDVEAEWCARAAAITGQEEEERLRAIRRGLAYYTRISPRCAAALEAMEARCKQAMEDGW